MTTSLARLLVRGLAGRGYRALSADVRGRAEAMLSDYLAVTSYGSRTDTARIAYRTAVDVRGTGGTATVIGRYGSVPPDLAALVNATACHSLEFDDIDVTSFIHYGAPVASAALAVAEREHADGRTLVAAVAAGCELMARLSDAMNPELRDRGFHGTTALGPFGGALAAGILLGLDEDGLVNALALAGAQASGLMEIYGASMQKRFNPGFAARNAVTAALLAGNGATGEETVLEGTGGFGAAFAGRLDRDRLLDGLGVRDRASIAIKPYACVRPIHSALDAIVALRDEHRLRPDDVVRITVGRPATWSAFFTARRPRSRHEAQVSLPFAVAAVAVFGDADPHRFDPPTDPTVLTLADRVVSVTDPDLHGDLAARVEIECVDGRVLSAVRSHARGGPELPLSDAERRDKARRLARSVYGSAADDAVRRMFGVADVPDVAVLLGELQTAVDGGR